MAQKKDLQGLGFEAWSMWKSWSLILPYTKNLPSNAALGWGIWKQLLPHGARIWTNHIQKFKCPGVCQERGGGGWGNVRASNW